MLNTLFWLLGPPGVPSETVYVRLKREVKQMQASCLESL